MNHIENLIFVHLNDEATEDEVKELFQWIQEDPANAREYARCSLLHAQLRGSFHGEQQANNSTAISDIRNPSNARQSTTDHSGQENKQHLSLNQNTTPSGKRVEPVSNWRRPGIVAGILTATLILGIGLTTYWLGDDAKAGKELPSESPSTFFATVSQTTDAKWSGREFQNGDRTPAGEYELDEGFIRLRIDSGVEITLQAPAKFNLISQTLAKLSSGVLTATVPPGAEGFRVDTPTAQVVDLGTAFGVRLDENGNSKVTVFDGEVNVKPLTRELPELIKEGESVLVEPKTGVCSVTFDSKSFEKLWPTSSGISGSNGAFRIAPPWPRRLRFVRSNDEIFVAPEGYITRLTEPLKVNISTPGEYRSADQLVASEIPSDHSVRSFIFHFHPNSDESRKRFRRTKGSITFNRPVLGIIVLHEELSASASRFPGRKAGELLEHRQLELNGTNTSDIIKLSDDRLTVNVDLVAPGRFLDLVRVIVDASYEN